MSDPVEQEPVATLLKRQVEDFARMAADLRTLTAETGDTLAKADGFSPDLRKSLGAFDGMVRALAHRLDNLARQPLPLPLRSTATFGNA